MSKNRGFTLIELVIVVAIVAILAAIALPSFLSQIRKSRRSEAQGAMQSAALGEERVRADCTTYVNASVAADWTTAPTGCASTVTLGGNPYTSAYYTLTITGSSGTAYTVNATAIAGKSQVNDTAYGTSCSTLKYAYSAGVITKTPTDCWAK